MKGKEMFAKSIGLSSGVGFLGILTLVGLMTSLFALWAFSCLGGAACDLTLRVL